MLQSRNPYMKLFMCNCKQCRAGRSGSKTYGSFVVRSNKRSYRNEFKRMLRTLTTEEELEEVLPVGRGSLYTD